MTDTKCFEERYQSGDTPWDHNAPDSNLINTVTQQPITSCKALDIGCGTGDNSIWLAQHGFTVTGSDISPTAIKLANEKIERLDLEPSFYVNDFLCETVPGGLFGLAFDRGCFHSFSELKERLTFAKNVASHLEKNGFWLTLTGNIDDGPREVGPPQLSAEALMVSVEPYFKVISLKSGVFGAGQDNPPGAWVCLMQKR